MGKGYVLASLRAHPDGLGVGRERGSTNEGRGHGALQWRHLVTGGVPGNIAHGQDASRVHLLVSKKH